MAAAGGVTVVVGNTIRVIKSVYDAHKILLILGAASAAAGATALTEFDNIPDLTDITSKLAAIIAMKVLVNDDHIPFNELPPAPDNPAPGLTDAGEEYILGKHVEGAPNYTPEKGTWPQGTTGEDLDHLAEAAKDSPARGPNKNGRYEREIDAGRVIGSVSRDSGGHATSRYKVVTDRFGGVITMYPIP